ncbi:hypothetical protein [Streptomyces klenkii]|uniref:hypothetical protein n=1 Tax=Streptomyces klenkii TaxID=1420899 RepID=UPI003428BD18
MSRTLAGRLAGLVGATALALSSAVLVAPAAHADQSACAQAVAMPTSITSPQGRTAGQSSLDSNLGCLAGTLPQPVGGILCSTVNNKVAGVPQPKTDVSCSLSATG